MIRVLYVRLKMKILFIAIWLFNLVFVDAASEEEITVADIRPVIQESLAKGLTTI